MSDVYFLCVAGLSVRDHVALTAWCKTNDISLVVIGPENLLAEGVCDSLIDAGKYNTDLLTGYLTSHH